MIENAMTHFIRKMMNGTPHQSEPTLCSNAMRILASAGNSKVYAALMRLVLTTISSARCFRRIVLRLEIYKQLIHKEGFCFRRAHQRGARHHARRALETYQGHAGRRRTDRKRDRKGLQACTAALCAAPNMCAHICLAIFRFFSKKAQPPPTDRQGCRARQLFNSCSVSCWSTKPRERAKRALGVSVRSGYLPVDARAPED